MHVPNSFQEAERSLKAGSHLSGKELATAIEGSSGEPIPDVFGRYLIGYLRQNARLPRGRKSMSDAAFWFTYCEAFDRYREKLPEFREEDKAKRARAREAGDKLPKGEASAHERATALILDEMRETLREISEKTLQHAFVKMRNWEYSAEIEVPPDDHDPPDHDFCLLCLRTVSPAELELLQRTLPGGNISEVPPSSAVSCQPLTSNETGMSEEPGKTAESQPQPNQAAKPAVR